MSVIANKINSYQVLKQKHQEAFNNFPMKFAFSNEQFKKGMEELGLKENDTDKIYSAGGGGFYRREDSKKLQEILLTSAKEMKAAIDNDPTGENFIYDMFIYELANHEYGYTGELDEALDALDLTMEEIKKDKRLLKGLKLAQKRFFED